MRHVLRSFSFHKHVQLFQHHLLKRRSFHLSVPFEPLLKIWEFLGGPMVRTQSFQPWAWVWFLVGELRSCKPYGTARPGKKKNQLTMFLDFVFCLLSVYSCINTTLFWFEYYSFIYILKFGSMMLLCFFRIVLLTLGMICPEFLQGFWLELCKI